jgi:hypothetical protein
VIPTEGGYLVEVQILKELEDLDKPEHATAGGATLRHDGSLVRQEGAAGRFSHTLGWIPVGRDASLEQTILADLAVRLNLPSGGWSLPAEAMVEELKSPIIGKPEGMDSWVEELPPPRSEELPPPGEGLLLPQP